MGKAIVQNDGGHEARAQGVEEGGGVEVRLGREGPLVVLGIRAQVNAKVFDAITEGRGAKVRREEAEGREEMGGEVGEENPHLSYSH